MGEPLDHRPPGWIRQSRKCCAQTIHNHMVVDYPRMSRAEESDRLRRLHLRHMKFVREQFCLAASQNIKRWVRDLCQPIAVRLASN